MARVGIGTWTRPSASGWGIYTITLWSDGTSSCDCPGWRFQRKGQPRTCKHVREPAITQEMRDVFAAHQARRTRESGDTPTRADARPVEGLKPRVMSWTRPSADQTTTYELVLFQDGSRACACPDFVYRRQERGERCKHIARLANEMDRAWAAWQEARTGRSTATPAQGERLTRRVRGGRAPAPPAPKPPEPPAKPPPYVPGTPVKRAIRFEDE
jgi:SWIM zinc finger